MTNYLGVTPPLSLDSSSESDKKATEVLIKTLHRFNVFEPEDEARRREIVLSKLNVMVKKFVKEVALERNLPEAVANEAGGKIFTFGSYRLGVHGTGADIDTLCVVPRFVQREDFFSRFHDTLKECSEVTELTAVPDSYVPVIKMCFDKIPIDLVFARLNLSNITEDLSLYSDDLLKNLDEKCVRSLNGSRVTDQILRLVPSVPTFRTTLRVIKLWAKKRAIYGNVMGFPGGVAWAMMVARVCQLYPNVVAATMVGKFFRILAKWEWPAPILLKNIEDGPLAVRVWNPKTYPADRAHRMPVITPAYPSMCATHNVTQSTLRIIISELNRGAEFTDKILKENLSWDTLFEKNDFFHKYKYYLQVIASSDNIDSHRVWSSFVESRIRTLVLRLELVELLAIAHPFVKGFEKTVKCFSEQQAIDAGRGIFHHPQNGEKILEESADSNESLVDEKSTEDTDDGKIVHTTTFYVGLSVEKNQASGTGPKRLDISWPTNEFTKTCKTWENYDENSMGICVKYIKSSALPGDVFEEGEQRKPKRPKARKNNSVQSQPLKKRKSQTSLDELEEISKSEDGKNSD